MHKHTQHVGKVPSTFPALPEVIANFVNEQPVIPSSVDRLSELKQALSKSVEDEDYEEAARLRDAISQLEMQLGSS
ncbi:MAG: UvrB/UvrC motif-containing protein [Verrucomicrobiales bacterium]